MDVLMPQLGETVAEGKIAKWFKSAGDQVRPGENLFEIETDKVSMEVPAIAGGVLSEIRVPAGATVPVGAVVAVISEAGAAGAQATPAAVSAAQPSAAGKPIKLDPYFEVRTPARNFGPARLPGGTRVTPLARRLAAEHGIDLGAIVPSGAHGRIVARDVEAAIRARAKAAPAAAPAAPPIAPVVSAEQVKALYAGAPYEEIPLDAMRATIARRLVEAKQTIPHFYLSIDVEMDKLLRLREEANAGAPSGANGAPAYKLSVNDFLIKALALALQRVPAANAAWAGDRILRFRHSNVAVAVAFDGGLITPVIRRAEGKSLSAISNEMKELAARARARKLMPDEYQGGATTISNLGMHGVREFSAIINPPQATLLAVGAAQRRPIESAEGVKFVSQMTVTLSCDHRVVDGALGAELLAAFRRLVENPALMLV